MTSLSPATLDHVPASVARPSYDRDAVTIGVVHFGPGAFHRAHQAAYFNDLLDRDPRWGIAAVSLRTPDVVDALRRQEGLYSLMTLEEEAQARIIGAHRAWFGPGDGRQVLDLLGQRSVRLVTTTVTEKGYCLGGDGRLDLEHPDIRHDLGSPALPRSVIGWIVAGAARRRADGVEPFAVLCCDNMPSNGDRLFAATIELARRIDTGLADWIDANMVFPNTMVDSITPATDPSHRARVRKLLDLDDDAAVQRETFTQWVVEDLPLPGSPDLAAVGVVRTSSVASYERAKLRMLNGAHSALAYLGIGRGRSSVADAMRDEPLASLVETMVREDVIPSLGPNPGLDAQRYADDLFARFRNPGINHLLSQIAWDGSQKLPYRLLETLDDARSHGRPIERLLLPIAAWMHFVATSRRTGAAIVDPLADQLTAIASASVDDEALVSNLLGLRQIFPQAIAADPIVRTGLISAMRALERNELSAR